VAIIEGFQRPPWRRVTVDRVTEAQEVDVRIDRGLGFGQLVLATQGNEPILRINPLDRGHAGLLGRSQLKMIGPAVGVDDEIRDDVRPNRLDKNMNLLARSDPTFRITDDGRSRLFSI